MVLSRDIPWLADLYLQGRLKLDELISARWPLEKINGRDRGYQSGGCTAQCHRVRRRARTVSAGGPLPRRRSRLGGRGGIGQGQRHLPAVRRVTSRGGEQAARGSRPDVAASNPAPEPTCTQRRVSCVPARARPGNPPGGKAEAHPLRFSSLPHRSLYGHSAPW